MDTATKQANQLHDMRISAGISPEHLAYKLGLAVKTVYNWEHTSDVKPHQMFAYRVAIEEVSADRGTVTRGFHDPIERYFQPELLAQAVPATVAANIGPDPADVIAA